MDPITLLLIGTGGAALAGVTAAVGPLVRHLRLRRARDLVTRPIIGALASSDSPRSVYDVFSDLGSTEYALEVMRHMDLIPENEEDLEIVAINLSDAISSFGSYDQLVGSLNETIQELSHEGESDHAEILDRRLMLNAPRQTDALLPAVSRPSKVGDALPEGKGTERLEADAGPSSTGSDGRAHTSSVPEEERLHATVDDALAELFGDHRSPHAGALEGGAGGLAAIVVGGVLGSLTTGGGFWDGVSRFVHKRRVKQMRTHLNSELSGLSLDIFHAPAQISQQVERNLSLLVQEKRWTVERRRRDTARHRKLPRKQRSSALQALKLLASQEAYVALSEAERDVKKLTAQITRHRRSGRHDLAGFLIYVNRTLMLRGIDDFDHRFQAIEDAGEQLRQALLAEAPQLNQTSQPDETDQESSMSQLPGPGQPLRSTTDEPGPGGSSAA